MTINAQAAWAGDCAECVRLYRQWRGPFGGNFGRLRRHYGWTRAAMIRALRVGQGPS